MMPEVINRQVTGDLPVFPAGEGKGGVFSPLPNDVKEGKLRAHAMQTILVAPQALHELWRDVESAPLWMECLVSVNLTGALLKHVENGDIDPTFLISHRCGIDEVPDLYRMWRDQQDAVTKIVIDPWADILGQPVA